MRTSCPDVAKLADFASGRLQAGYAARLERHVDACARCAALLPVGLSSRTIGSKVPPESKDLLAVGTILGRYQVLRWVGSGAMGDVYEGFDPELQRKVALKLLRSEIAGDAKARERLVLEARVMARLSHPNVVSVMDLGVFDGRVFLVMELVEGLTLASWLRERQRSWSEIVSMFLGAGAGLTAAHALSVIHRDFKPQNVLVGVDGTARVTDFGLARWTDEARGSHRPGAESSSPMAAPANAGWTNSPIGTPRYMAPEQQRGDPIDVRADQYSFCVALFEALFGHELCQETIRKTAAKDEGHRAWKVTGHREVPRHVRRALLRGLSPLPDSRFGSMIELLGAIRSPRRVRRWAIVAISAVLSVVGAGIWLTRSMPPFREIVPEGNATSVNNARSLAQLSGRVHCLSLLPSGRVARVIWGSPRRAEDIEIATGRRTLSELEPVAFREGCPELSSDGKQLIFEGFDDAGRAHIFLAENPVGRDARPVVPSAEPSVASEPQWLAAGKAFAFDLDFRHVGVFTVDDGRTTVIARATPGDTPGTFKAVDARTGQILVFYQRNGRKADAVLYRWPSLLPEKQFAMEISLGRWRFDSTGTKVFGPVLSRGGLLTVGAVVDLVDVRAEYVLRGGADESFGDVIDLDSSLSVLAFRKVRERLWFRDSAGNPQEVPLEPGDWIGSVDVTPDGVVVYVIVGPANRSVIGFDPASRSRWTISNDARISALHVFPDGDAMVIRDDGANGFERCGIDLSSCRRIYDRIVLEAALSPDGKWVAVLTGGARGVVAEIVSATSGSRRTLAASISRCQPIWTDNERVWISRREHGQLTWVELAVGSGEPTGRRQPGETDCFTGVGDQAPPVRGRAWFLTTYESEIRVGALSPRQR